MITLAIDPGIRGCGIAVFGCDVLQLARYVKNPIREGDGPDAIVSMALAVRDALAVRNFIPTMVNRVVIEWPQVYAGAKNKGDANDLLPLAGVDAAICALFLPSKHERFRPREWKGQLPPNVCAQRIIDRLKAEELARVDRIEKFQADLSRAVAAKKEIDGTDHNTIDAVGIGLKACGRFERRLAI